MSAWCDFWWPGNHWRTLWNSLRAVSSNSCFANNNQARTKDRTAAFISVSMQTVNHTKHIGSPEAAYSSPFLQILLRQWEGVSFEPYCSGFLLDGFFYKCTIFFIFPLFLSLQSMICFASTWPKMKELMDRTNHKHLSVLNVSSHFNRRFLYNSW